MLAICIHIIRLMAERVIKKFLRTEKKQACLFHSALRKSLLDLFGSLGVVPPLCEQGLFEVSKVPIC